MARISLGSALALIAVLHASFIAQLEANNRCTIAKKSLACPSSKSVQDCIRKIKGKKRGSSLSFDITECFKVKTKCAEKVAIQLGGGSNKCDVTPGKAIVKVGSRACGTLTFSAYAYDANFGSYSTPKRKPKGSKCDGNLCTLCAYSNLQISLGKNACDDSLDCTEDICKSNKCINTAKQCDDDGDKCTEEKCVEGTGCTSTPIVCKDEDNNKCTEEKCVEGKCLKATKDCDDNNSCTDDKCDAATGTCSNTDIPKCACKSDADCDDGNKCTADTCDKATGKCKNAEHDFYVASQLCNDNNNCTIDTCNPYKKECVNTPVSCDDNKKCTKDVCNPATGKCENTLYTKKEEIDWACYDGLACTVADCNAAGDCIQKAKCDDGNPCTNDSCNEANSGECKNVLEVDPMKVAVLCNDTNPCTEAICTTAGCKQRNLTDIFSGGDLDKKVQDVCDDKNFCTTATCDYGAGTCKQNNKCDDKNPCTEDYCDNNGNCIYKSLRDIYKPVDLPDKEAAACAETPDIGCTIGYCDYSIASGSQCKQRVLDKNNPFDLEKIQQVCGDGNPCSVEDCTATGCIKTLLDSAQWPEKCKDDNPCTVGKCTSVTQNCTQELIDSSKWADACKDDYPCTTGSCTLKGCEQKHRCDDGIDCTLDQCALIQGATSGSKDDRDYECINTVYSSYNKPAPICDDQDACTDDVCFAESTTVNGKTTTKYSCKNVKQCKVQLVDIYAASYTKVTGVQYSGSCPPNSVEFSGTDVIAGNCPSSPKCCVYLNNADLCDFQQAAKLWTKTSTPATSSTKSGASVPTNRQASSPEDASCPINYSPAFNCFVLKQNTPVKFEDFWNNAALNKNYKVPSTNNQPTCQPGNLEMPPNVVFPRLPSWDNILGNVVNYLDVWDQTYLPHACNQKTCDLLVKKKFGPDRTGVCCAACVPDYLKTA